MFRTVLLSIITSFSLYIQQWYMSYRFAYSFRAGSGRFVVIMLTSCNCNLYDISSWFYYRNNIHDARPFERQIRLIVLCNVFPIHFNVCITPARIVRRDCQKEETVLQN